MKLATFRYHGQIGYGMVIGDEVTIIHGHIPGAPPSLRAALAAGPDGFAAISRLSVAAQRAPLAQVHLLPPIPDPRKYMCLGGNYASHLAEAAALGHMRATGQIWFNKQVSCISGPYDPIHLPKISKQLDYEGELGVVIGKRCRNVPRDAALRMIAGYVVCNDVSVRDWQLRAPTHTLGKSFDTHGPFGPFLVTPDEIAEIQALDIRVTVNGEVRQAANTRDMIHDLGAQLEELTQAVTFEPGDILATGSPAGVGGLMRPPRYLIAGDVVRVQIEGLGYIENRVIEEPDAEEAYAPSAPQLLA